MKGLMFWLLYFAPALIGWYRVRQGKPLIYSTGQLFLFNLLIAWTVVGWFLLLANALGFNPVASLVPRLVKFLPGGQSGSTPQTPQSSSQGAACSQCQGSGSMTCSSCSGRGSWYDPPQGQNGVAQLRTCPACTSSGRLRCSSCGGSGRAAALI
jgi:hypothetical protein